MTSTLGNMTPTNITVTRGDVLYNINFTVKQSDLNDSSNFLAVNLSGATIKFKVAPVNNISSLIINGTCTASDATNGLCYYQVKAGDFATAGQYRGELEITYTATGEIITAPKIYITCVPDLG